MTKIDKNLIKELSELMDKNNLSELKYSDGKFNYELKKRSQQTNTRSYNSTSKKDLTEKSVQIDSDRSLKSPLVGTAYLSPEPGAKKFVEIGENVKIGQVLLIVEAMKTMNEITADKEGIIKKIFIKNGAPVEFGEPLVLIE